MERHDGDGGPGGGCPLGPVLTFSGTSTPYIDYGSIDVLLSLQHPRTAEPAELTFHVMTQVQELLFKLLHEDLCRVRDLLAAGRARAATRALGRLRRVTELLNGTWDVLDTLAPTEFAALRPGLGDASGVQSFMFRMVEFTLGRKEPAYASLNAHVPGIGDLVRDALARPSVYDAALAYLGRSGLPVPREVLEHDPATAREPDPRVERVWARVYQEGAPGDELFELAEAMVAVAEGVSRWRLLHLLTAERVLGAKPGTGGSDGLAWLRRAADLRYFPELWSARRLI
jgi:tryptophan 2,3-dioxygenase